MELTASTTILLRTLIYLEEMLTQEELPMEPGSGSGGSSTVESTLTTSMWSATPLLVVTLTGPFEIVVRSTARAGHCPYQHDYTRPQHQHMESTAMPLTAT